MRCFFLHIIFLCCSVLGYGQEKFPFLISYNGEDVPLTISIEDNAVSKLNSNTIKVDKEKLENNLFDIQLEANEEFLVECSSSNLEEFICQDKITVASGFDAKVVNPNNGSSVTFKILSPDGNTELALHTINIQLTTTLKKESEIATTSNNTTSISASTTTSKVKPIPATASCVGKKPEERLECLKDLNETSSEIESLESEKNEILKELKYFKKEDTDNKNRYKITCTCSISNYEISVPNSKLIKESEKWKEYDINDDSKVTIKHQKWESLKSKSISLKYEQLPKKVVKKDKPEKSKSEDIEIEIDSPITEKIEQLEVVTDITEETNSQDKQTGDKFDLKKYLWHILIGILVVFLLIRELSKSKSITEDVEDTPPPNIPKQSETSGEISKIQIQSEATDEIPEIQIQEVEKSAEEAAAKLPLAQLEKSDDFVLLDLSKCWNNTTVSKIFFGKESIREIAEMVGTQNAYDPTKQSIDELSEIGGFLLGHFYPQKNGEYYVSISTFVPITPEVNNRYTVKFGDEAWVELDDAYKNHPGERLVGWFHTHPGHGLFLSNADIKVHTEAFAEKYQFAMEIDPTTPGCDTAFFTRKKDNTLNNQKDRMLPRWDRLKVLELHSKEK